MTPNLVVTRSTRASGPNKFDFFSNFIYNIYIEKRKKEKNMITEKSETIIKLLNNVIEEAVKHGGDSGGPYLQNQYGLIVAVSNFLNCINLSHDYEVDEANTESDKWSDVVIKARHGVFKIEE